MKVLLVDDDPVIRRAVRALLGAVEDLEIADASSIDDALAAIDTNPPDMILLDVRLSAAPGDRGGLDLLAELRRAGLTMPTVMITSSTEIDHLREAMRLGAIDYVLKDEMSAELLTPIVESIRERFSLRREVARLRTQVDRAWGIGAIVGESAAMERLRKLVTKLADADSPVLIRGETGTGKELVARALHQSGRRRELPYVAVNCSALPGTLMESLLFGHQRGAFTGADRRVRGHLELAADGTLLLDEIAELPIELQAKLLRVLEEKKFRPLGSERELPLRARIVAATHVDLEKRIAEKTFREDLYYRLNVVVIEVPRLEDRLDDLPQLVLAFVEKTKRPLRFTQRAMAWLEKRRWRGNVRELRNVIERLALLAEDDLIDVPTLETLAPSDQRVEGSVLDRLSGEILAMPSELGSRLELVERALVRHALEQSDGNVSAAARLLGIPRNMLRRKLDKRPGRGVTTEP